MNVATSTGRARGSWTGVLFRTVWLILGLAAIVYGAVNLRGSPNLLSGARSSYVITIVFGCLAVAAAAADTAPQKGWRAVGASIGAVFGLYGLAMILMGHEDVGGFRFALPIGALAIALGWWSIARFVRRKAKNAA